MASKERAGSRGSLKPANASERGQELVRRALANGRKPVKDVRDLARGTPEDADELLEAIRELRRESD
jgi:hypothetical protein